MARHRQLGVLKTCIRAISMMGRHQLIILVFVRHTTFIHSIANFSDGHNYKICCLKRVEIARCFGAKNICSIEKRSASVAVFTIIPDVPRWRKRKIENSMFLLLFRFVVVTHRSMLSGLPGLIGLATCSRCLRLLCCIPLLQDLPRKVASIIIWASTVRDSLQTNDIHKRKHHVLVAGRVVTSHIVEWKIFIFTLIESINK